MRYSNCEKCGGSGYEHGDFWTEFCTACARLSDGLGAFATLLMWCVVEANARPCYVGLGKDGARRLALGKYADWGKFKVVPR